MPQLLEIPAQCAVAAVLQHDRGHSVPSLRPRLKHDVLAALQWLVSSAANQLLPVKPDNMDSEAYHWLARWAM